MAVDWYFDPYSSQVLQFIYLFLKEETEHNNHETTFSRSRL